VAIATTAIFILGSGFNSQQPLLGERIGELALGVAIGLAVNLIVVPPLRDQQAARYVDSINRRMGDVLCSMGREFRESWDTDESDSWLQETLSMSRELNSAWASVRFARESRRANPRGYLGTRRAGPHSTTISSSAKVGYEDILERVDEGISHLRNLTRTLAEASYDEGRWDDRFRAEWADIAADAGQAVADPDADVEPIHARLDELSTRLAQGELPSRSWPLYGALITSLRHIAVIVDDVASARSARESD
jgi:hypothetical protein